MHAELAAVAISPYELTRANRVIAVVSHQRQAAEASMRIDDSRTLLALAWPQFVCVHDCIFLASEVRSEDKLNMAFFQDLTGAEASVNHVHLLDHFEHDASLSVEPFWDSQHPDFRTACEIAKTIAKIWAAKLMDEFPERSFRIYYSESDNPIIRFHTVRSHEPPWASEHDWRQQILDGTMLIWQVDRAESNV